MDEILAKLRDALDRARETEKENRSTGNTETRAFDAGRADGLKQACEIAQEMRNEESITP